MTRLLLLVVTCFAAGQLNAQPVRDQDVQAWVAQALTRIQIIHVGMNRSQLTAEFATEGGLFTGLRRTYVYRNCPLIKVDVEFEPVGRPARDAEGRVTLVEADQDVITSISRPYLAFSVVD